MEKEEKKFLELIEKSQNILILAHNGPDLDAFCSMLFAKIVLSKMYPKKKFIAQVKQGPTINLPEMNRLSYVEKLDSSKCDMILVVDSGDITICVNDDDNVDYKTLPVVFVDHHNSIVNNGDNCVLINHHASSATEELYMLFTRVFGKKFKLDNNTAKLVQYGIVADTGRFLYDLTTPNTHRVYADAMAVAPIDLEDFSYRNSKFPKEAVIAMQEYLKTLTIVGDMAYMYIDRKTIDRVEGCKKGVGEAQSFIRDRFLRFIQGVHWGFVIKPDPKDKNGWFISFRSTKGYQNVREIAEDLGGGGHELASGVPFKAKNLNEVLMTTLSVINKHCPDIKNKKPIYIKNKFLKK